MFKSTQKYMRAFQDDQKGTLTIEAVIILPILLWAIIATYTFFDAFKIQNAANRANYTIGDMLSRETVEVNQAYLDSMHNLFLFMAKAKAPGTWIRVSVVKCQSSCDKPTRKLALVWSNSTNGARKLKASDFDHYDSRIPALPKGDRLILVETSTHYTPPFVGFGLNFSERDIVAHSVTRPRFAPQLLWSNI